MRSGQRRALAAAGITLAAVSMVPAAAAAKTASFKVTAVQSSPQGQITMTSNVWITPTQARAEMHHPIGGDMTVLISKGFVYELDPKTKTGVKAKLPAAFTKSKDNFDFLISRMAFNGAPMLKTAKKVRTEKFAGFTCDVYSQSVTKSGSSRQITLWMPQKMSPKFAVKAIVATSVKKPGLTAKETLTVSLSNIKLGQAIPAARFAVPSGYKISEGELPPPPGARK